MSDEMITDKQGRVIGRFSKEGSKTVVFDEVGRRLGYSDYTGTYDEFGRFVSAQNVPGLLLDQ